MQVARSLAIERLAVPKWLGGIVANATKTWPLIGLPPLIFWLAWIWMTNPEGMHLVPITYSQVVPHWLIYLVFFSATGFAGLCSVISLWRAWRLWGNHPVQIGVFFKSCAMVFWEVASHSRFGLCTTAGARRWGHFLLLWGFLGAAISSGFIVIGIYLFGWTLPVAQLHWTKLLANLSAACMAIGAAWLLSLRLRRDHSTGTSTAYDNFFFSIVALTIVTGLSTEIGRYTFSPETASIIYGLHLSSVLTLFVTMPYSKFAHFLYRTMAMVHEQTAASTTPVHTKME
jgi:quinone-modifying oxidoreductase subunit QmoC